MSIETPLSDERSRLEALAAYQIIDTPREAAFDAFARIAAQMCGVEMACMSFVDVQREWFKAKKGFDRTWIARDKGFADATMTAAEVLEVGDASRDERFKNCTLVCEEPKARFYAGVALRSPQGYAIGTFAAMSSRPHALTEQQREGLSEFARAVMQALEIRRELREVFVESESAREQISLLLQAIDVAGDVILVYRAGSATDDLILTYMNGAYTGQTGYTREEALGRSLTQLRHAMPDDPGMEHLRDALARGEAASMEIVSYRKDGSTFWNQVTLHPIRSPSGEITHWITIERDVTEAIERESKLEDQHARLLLLISAARRLFSALDYRALLVRLEDAVRELIGDHAKTFVHEVIRDSPADIDDELIARAARTHGHVTDERMLRAAAAAGMTERAAHVIEVRMAEGRPLRSGDLYVLDLLAEYFGVAVRNASLVAELEERRSAILELNQVKTDLIAMLAHDFKSPLTSIVGFTELAMDLGEVNADQREYLESVKRIALRLADLASDTLAFSRLERNEIDLALADVDLCAMAKETSEVFGDQRKIAVSTSGEGVVRGDANRLRQVFYNLVENAIKYSPEGQQVEIRVRALTTDGRPGVRVQVIDRGIGVPRKELKSVFGRFSRASNARKLRIAGTGFGLYLARQIVELHGGSISASSTEGKGSTFTVDLPRTAAPLHEAPLSVAVLESERDSRSFIAHALREAGLRVHVHHSLEELLDWMEVDHVDRIVIDVDDTALAKEQVSALEVQQSRRGFTVIAVGSAERPALANALRLAKPFLVQDLLTAILSRPA